MKALPVQKSRSLFVNKSLLSSSLRTTETTLQPTYAWCVKSPLQNSYTIYFFASIVSTIRNTQSTTFHHLRDVKQFLGEHHCRFPSDLDVETVLSPNEARAHHSYVVIHEAMLGMNSVELFLERIKSFTKKQFSDIHTFIPLDNQTDVLLFSLELNRAIFDVVDPSQESLYLARKNTLEKNVASLQPLISHEQIVQLCMIIEEATFNPNSLSYYREELHKLCVSILSETTYVKRLDCSPDNAFTLLPQSQFGVLQCTHGLSSALDYLLQDLSATYTYFCSVATERYIAHHTIEHFYDDKIIPLLNTILVDKEHTFSLSDVIIKHQLRQNTQPLLLHQIFQQLHQSADIPILASWNDSTIVKRHMVQLRYFQDVIGETPQLFDKYSKYVHAHDSVMKIEVSETSTSPIQLMDIVLWVEKRAYIITLNTRGELTCPLLPIWNENDAPTHDNLSYWIDCYVLSFVPKCNTLIEQINQCFYFVPEPSNVSPSLLQIHMRIDDTTILCTRNTTISSYVANYRESSTLKEIAYALNHLQHFVVPTALQKCDNTPPYKFMTKEIQNKPLYDYCNDVLNGEAIHSLSISSLTPSMTLTMLCHHLVRRYAYQHHRGVIPWLKTLPALRLYTSDNEIKIEYSTRVKKHYLKSSALHLHNYHTLIVLLSKLLQQNRVNTLSSTTSSTSTQQNVLCTIPFVSSYSHVVLKNIEHLFKHKYIKHKNTAGSKNKYANQCQRPKQPWCVTTSHVQNMKKWCRYACVTAEFDYWKVKAYREYLDLLNENIIYNAPFSGKYMNLKKTHSELIHNYCRLIKLTMCKTTHHLISNTLKQLIVSVSEAVQNEHIDANTFTMKMIMNNAQTYEKYSKLRNMMIHILKEAYPDDEYGEVFEAMPAWAQLFHAVKRFAELLVYLRHPNETTNTGEDIYYCSPIYICTHCKTPLSNPESPQYYYAEPATNEDISEALVYGHKHYDGEPIVSASYRPVSTDKQDSDDYAYGNLSDTHMEDMKWLCTASSIKPSASNGDTTDTTATNKEISSPPDPDRRLNHSTPYAEFGTLYTLEDFNRKSSTTKTVLMIKLYQNIYGIEWNPVDQELVRVYKITKPPSHLSFSETSILYKDANQQYHLSNETNTDNTKKKVSVAKIPTEFNCFLHKVEVVFCSLPKPKHHSSVNTCYRYAVITHPTTSANTKHKYTAKYTATVVDRLAFPLCIRYRQRRLNDTLRCVYMSTKQYKKQKTSIMVSLFGCVQFESKRIQKTRPQKTSRKNSVSSKSVRSLRNKPNSTAQQQFNEVSTYTASLETMIQRKLIRIINRTSHTELHLQWHHCRSWKFTCPNKNSLNELVELNLKRKCTVHPNTATAYVEKAFPSSQLLVNDKSLSVEALLNDDTYFRCPYCNQANEYRTFREKERSAYGSIVGIIKPETNVNLDPDWLYVCSFKLLGVRLDSSAYASKWKRNPQLSSYQYSIPLQQRAISSNLRTKTFNCSVLKVTTSDTYSLNTLNLDAFFEQTTETNDDTFIMTGCMKPKSTDLFKHQRGSLQQLWQLTIEETIDLDWLNKVICPSMLLNVDNGRFIHTCMRQNKDSPIPIQQHVATIAHAQKWAKQHEHQFTHCKDVFSRIRLAYSTLQQCLLMNTELSNMFYVLWHMMTFVGYNLGDSRINIHYFFFDVSQTETRKNFLPALVCPPSQTTLYYWNPYTETLPVEQIHTKDDLLLFTMGVKMHCQGSYTDTFYLLRRNKVQLHNQYVYVCYKSRVIYFSDNNVSSLKQVKTLYNALRPLQKESLHMFVNAYLYYKLYKHVSSCSQHIWSANLTQQRLRHPIGRLETRDVLSQVFSQCKWNMQWTNHCFLHSYTLQPTHLQCMDIKTEINYYIPLQCVCQPDMHVVNSSTEHLNYPTFANALHLLNTISIYLPAYCPTSVQLNSINRIISIVLNNGGHVPITPVQASQSDLTHLSVIQPSVYMTSLVQRPTKQYTYISDAQSWNIFVNLCEKIAYKYHPRNRHHNHHHKDINISQQLQKQLPTVTKAYRVAVGQLIKQYGNTPIIHTVITQNLTNALRKYTVGIYTPEFTPTTHHLCFSATNETNNYATTHRTTADVLYHNVLRKKNTISEIAHKTPYIYRPLPPTYSNVLFNTRIYIPNAVKELIQTNNIKKEFASNKHSVILSESQLCSYLVRSLYILNEERFLHPTNHSTKPIAIEKSMTIITRPAMAMIEAMTQSTNHSCLRTKTFPLLWQKLHQSESNLHVNIFVGNQPTHTPFKTIIQKVSQVKSTDSVEYRLLIAPPVALVSTEQDQPVRVHLDQEFHRVKHYEILKHRVGQRMKNLQYENIPEICTLQNKHHKPSTKGNQYILL